MNVRALPVVPHSAEGIAPDEALKQVWCELAGHAEKASDSPVDTLNRLVDKHFRSRFENEPREIPTFHEQNVGARFDWWSTEALNSLWLGHQRATPGGLKIPPMTFVNLPVIVLQIDALACLIDGNNRINKRLADGLPEPHPVYLLHKARDAASK